MELKIKRDKEISYNIEKSVKTLLETLIYIKENIDATINFDYGCKSGVCGACSVRVNGKERLACSCIPSSGDTVEPLRYYPIKRDLIVDKTYQKELIKNTKAYINSYKTELLCPEDEQKTQIQTDCILCSSCYSACPVIEVNQNFQGPFALTKTYRYIIDTREDAKKEHIDSTQTNGIWDCTLCGECTLACPQGINPKTDIINLRNISVKHGYTDPNFANLSFGSFGDFNS